MRTGRFSLSALERAPASALQMTAARGLRPGLLCLLRRVRAEVRVRRQRVHFASTRGWRLEKQHLLPPRRSHPRQSGFENRPTQLTEG